MAAAAAACLLMLPLRASADPCRTVTSRPAQQIVSTRQAQPSLTILPGERLCLDPNQQFRVVDLPTSPVFDLSFTSPPGRSVLRLNNPWNERVQYQVAVSRDGHAWEPFDTAEAPASSVDVRSWPGTVQALAITELHTVSASTPTIPPAPAWQEPPFSPPPPFYSEGERRGWIAVSLVQTIRRPQLSSLDAELVKHGYGPISRSLPQWGLAFDGEFRRFRGMFDLGFAGAGGYHRLSDRERFNIHQFSVGGHVGYSVLQYGLLSVFPAVGLEAGALLMSIDPSQPPFLDNELPSKPDDNFLGYAYGAVVAGLGMDTIIPIHRSARSDYGLLIGFKAGYVQQFAHGSWMQGDRELPALERSGSSPSVSGPMLRFSIGLAESEL